MSDITAIYYVRRHGSDVHLGMCPIKMATPILMYLEWF